jgi:hypothetical protein
VGLLLFSIGFVSIQPLHAILVEPSRQEVTLGIGETAEGRIETYNDTASTLTVRISAKDWFVLKENSHIHVEDWLEFHKSEYVLFPGQREFVPFTVRVPTGTAEGPAPQGTLVAMMSVASDSNQESMVNLMISVSVYVTVKGTEKPGATIKQFLLRKGQAGGDIQAVTEIENTGNVHLRPTGHVEVFDRKGRLKGQTSLQEARPVYPGQSRAYFGVFPNPQWKNGLYRATLRVQLWDKSYQKDYFFRFKKGEILALPEEKAKKIWRN